MQNIINIYKKHREGILYLFFGGTSFVLNMALYALFTYALHMNELIANFIAWIIVVAYAFVTNKFFVFQNKTKSNLLTQIISFYMSRIATLCIEELIIFVFITKLEYNSLIIKLIAQIIVIVLNYILSKLIIFKARKEK